MESTNNVFDEVFYHFVQASNEMEKRKTRKNGWDDVLRAYHSALPKNWPYLAKVTDPLIRTVIHEKTARLINNKLRGDVVPREGGDVIKAKVQNALLSYQWDQATNGGTMLEKWIMMDIQTRLFGASFGLAYWDKRYEGKKLSFEGNEFKVLDNRDVLVDYTATHVRNSKWCQVREFVTIKDLEEKGIYQLEGLRAKLDKNSDARDIRYTSVTKQLRAMEDMVGKDRIFPTIEIVTEYRPDRWITFAPRYGEVILDVECPYKHKKIPLVQLRYYSTGDDIYGESEVEPVLPIARAVNSLLSATVDEVDISMRPPVKVANNSEVRKDTIVYGPNALWLTGSSVANVQEHQMGGQAVRNFQTLYYALKSAFNAAMGEMSAGVNNINPFENDKTATEVNASVRQTRVRDQYNQLFLEEALKEQMMFWLSNNSQFLLSDPTQQRKVMRIVGHSTIRELKEIGLDQMTHDDDGLSDIYNMVNSSNGEIDPVEIEMMMKEIEIPKYPVVMNPDEKDPAKYDIKPKLAIDEQGEFATLIIEKDDFDGVYDYIPSVKSMNIGVSDTEQYGRNQALQMLLNPAIAQQLQVEGSKVKIKELLTQVLEDNGVKNAERLFEDANELTGISTTSTGLGGTSQEQGMATPQAVDAGAGQLQMAQPQEVSQQGIGNTTLL